MDLAELPLEGGGSILVRLGDVAGQGPVADPAPPLRSGPIRAGRVQDRVDEVVTVASQSLRDALEPIAQMSRQVLQQLAQSGPQEVQVEFGVELTAEAGAVLTKAGTGCHLTVTLTWKPTDHPAPADG